MDSSDLEEQALIAVQEAIGTHTVAIDISLSSKDKPDWCTGSLILAEGRPLIITCKHAVRPDIKKEDLRFLFRSEKSFQWVTKNQIKKIDIRMLNKNKYKTFPKTIPLTNIIYSNDEDDLALLEVDESWADENINWFLKMDISKAGTPEAGHLVYYMGFSRELSRKATAHGDIGVFPFFGTSTIVTKEMDSTAFNQDSHFLIDFRAFETDEYNIDPHGLSRCGVWSRTPSGEGNLWTANIYLIGVQNGYFKKNEVLKATKIERVNRLI